MQIIGWDSAVQEVNNGLIRAELSDNGIIITGIWEQHSRLIEILSEWINRDTQTLLAIDSPLGWPEIFAKKLCSHQAGQPIGADPANFFKRQTDINIHQRFRKTPLEVSADRIARTAFFTLQRIGEIADRTGKTIDVVWDHKTDFATGMIEVYPAATLIANSINTSGYKNRENKKQRDRMLPDLTEKYQVKMATTADITAIEHNFDAFLCCLSGFDFLNGKCEPPPRLDEGIRKEGWTWVKNK